MTPVLLKAALIFLSAVNFAATAPKHHEALEIKEYMNPKIKPCDNFYDYVCGNFMKDVPKKEMPPQNNHIYMVIKKVDEMLRNSVEHDITDKDPESFKKMKGLYDLCLKDDDATAYDEQISDLQSVLEQLGDWPLMNRYWDEDDFDWIKLTLRAKQQGLKYEPFLSFNVLPDQNMTKKVKYLTLFQPSFKINSEVLADDSSQYERYAVFIYMRYVAETFGIDFTSYQARKDLKDTFTFMIKLAKLGSSLTELRLNPEQNLMTVGELQELFPYIDSWQDYLNAVMSPYKTMKKNDVIRILDLKYFARLGNLLESTPKRTLANYAVWSSIMDITPRAVHEASKEKKKQKITTECTTLLTNSMPLAAGSLYVRRHFDGAKKDTVMEIFTDLIDTFKKILAKVEWMEDETRMSAVNKLNHMKLLVAYPEELLNDEKLDDYYKELVIDKKSTAKTIRNFMQFFDAKKFQSLDKPETIWTEFGKNAATVNAYYYIPDNSVQFPAGILQDPFFNIDYPKYLNYGGLGFFAGHEITHGLDNHAGANTDEDSSEVKEEYLNKFGVQCLIDQYSSLTALNVTLNGLQTLAENIADNGGLKAAYNAYTSHHLREPSLPGLEQFSNKQMFWVMFTHDLCSTYDPNYLNQLLVIDEHSPFPFRVLGSLRNMPEFSKDFNCPKGSFMNPVKKCKVL